MWQRRDDWVGSQVDDQYVMIHLDSGRYMALNQTAAAAWHALETPLGRDDLVDTFVARFRVDPETCARSVDAMLDKMTEMGLIAPVDAHTGSTSN